MKKVILALAILLLCTTMFSSCDLILGLFQSKGIVTGYVHAANNTVVAGVLVTVDGSSETATTNSSGFFTIEIPEGSQTLHFTKTGYTFYDIVVLVVADGTVPLSEDVVGYTPLESGDIRIVLTWGATPLDLDSHLRLPAGADEIYWSHKTATGGSASLDWDDTTSYGPETITITTTNAGTYNYWVYNYSGTGSIKTSEAVVKVYNSNGLWYTFTASTASGDSSLRYWRVFTLNGTTISTLNTFNASGY